jgi:hypothetical protein
MFNWSITPGGSFARERPRSRQSWPGSLNGWGAAAGAGTYKLRGSARVACLAVSLRAAARSCEKSPNASVCDAWPTSPGVRRDDAILSLGSERGDPGFSPCRGMHASRLRRHFFTEPDRGRQDPRRQRIQTCRPRLYGIEPPAPIPIRVFLFSIGSGSSPDGRTETKVSCAALRVLSFPFFSFPRPEGAVGPYFQPVPDLRHPARGPQSHEHSLHGRLVRRRCGGLL